MKTEISIDAAINRGHLLVNLPVFIAMFGIPSLFHMLDADKKMVLIGLVSGFILGWLVWSCLITKWKIWAYENVANLDELKRKAIEEKLIWRDGHIFTKTEIRSRTDKIKLRALEKRFND